MDGWVLVTKQIVTPFEETSGFRDPFFCGACAIYFGLAWWRTRVDARPAPEPEAPAVQSDGEATWDDLQPVDLLGLELGYRLIAMVDKTRQGDLLTRIKVLAVARDQRLQFICRIFVLSGKFK